MSVLFHGSTHKLDILEPKSSKIVNDEAVVFATNSKDLAVKIHS